MITNTRLIKVPQENGLIGFFSCNYYELHINSIAVRIKDDGTIYFLCPKIKEEHKQLFYPFTHDLYDQILQEIKKLI